MTTNNKQRQTTKNDKRHCPPSKVGVVLMKDNNSNIKHCKVGSFQSKYSSYIHSCGAMVQRWRQRKDTATSASFSGEGALRSAESRDTSHDPDSQRGHKHKDQHCWGGDWIS